MVRVGACIVVDSRALKKYKDLYTDPRTFMMRIAGQVEGICPGYKQR